MELTTLTAMNKFFDLGDARYQRSLVMNAKLMAIPKEKLRDIFEAFDLLPVTEYFDSRTLNKENNQNIRGYIWYLDRYLIEKSGGRRSALTVLGARLTGTKPTAFSMRLMRMEIISDILKP